MKRLTDYKGEEALELWADLIDPLSVIFLDKKILKALQTERNKLKVASKIIKLHRKETEKILLRIDPTPLNALNVITRLVAIITDIGDDEDIQSFFGNAVEVKTDKESSGSATESIEVEEK